VEVELGVAHAQTQLSPKRTIFAQHRESAKIHTKNWTLVHSLAYIHTALNEFHQYLDYIYSSML
jgi:ABC-type long-subunit fatty acid transport system fused permease/ATPase subunit